MDDCFCFCWGDFESLPALLEILELLEAAAKQQTRKSASKQRAQLKGTRHVQTERLGIMSKLPSRHSNPSP